MGTLAVGENGNSRTTMRLGKVFAFHRKHQGQESALCSREHGDRYALDSAAHRLGTPPLADQGKKGGIRVGEKAQSLLRRFRRQETGMSDSMYPVVAPEKANLVWGHTNTSNQDPYASSIDTEDSGNICGHPIHDSAELLAARERFAMLANQTETEDVNDPDWCGSVSASEDETETATPSADIEDIQGTPRIEEQARVSLPQPLPLSMPPASGDVPAQLEIVMERRVGSYFLAANWLPTLTQSTDSSGILTFPEDDYSMEYSYREEPDPNGCVFCHTYFHDDLL